MTYSLEFHIDALAEWGRLDAATQARFKEKLAERLIEPRVPKDQLRGSKNRYKIKFKRPPLRLVYEVVDQTLVVAVIAIGKRESSFVYTVAGKRTYGLR